MRIDDLQFEYDANVFAYVSYLAGIDLVVQPLRKGFAAEVIDGAEVHRLGTFPSERWAKVAVLQVAEKISGRGNVAA
jgi:hypothetical protein